MLESPPGHLAAKPLFRDPIFDGAADPVVIWNRAERKWFLFYTNRRANVPDLPGVSWVYGSPIGIAESSDGGASWTYRGTANIPYGWPGNTFWAPDVIFHEGWYHMFLTFVDGIREQWGGPAHIVHLLSGDLINWEYRSTLPLASDRVIDAAVLRLPNGTWRLYYNNEVDGKSVYYADTLDLFRWVDRGKLGFERPGEGPKAFFWKGRYWMIVDHWSGLGVYHSSDGTNWTPQNLDLLSGPGLGIDDQVIGNHADVVLSGDRAYLFYFTHPGRQGPDAGKDTLEQRRTSIQVAELTVSDGLLQSNRNAPCRISLPPPFCAG